MSIVKRKNASGKVYYFNTATSKFASEAAYKRSKTASIDKYKARKGQPSKATCSNYGSELKKKETSFAGKHLRDCVRPSEKDKSRKAMFANIAARSRRGK
jgi:hypothetical protein